MVGLLEDRIYEGRVEWVHVILDKWAEERKDLSRQESLLCSLLHWISQYHTSTSISITTNHHQHDCSTTTTIIIRTIATITPTTTITTTTATAATARNILEEKAE